MQQYSGKSVYKGIVQGPVTVIRRQSHHVNREEILDVGAEIERVGSAVKYARKQLQILHDKAVEEIGTAGAAIFEVHIMILEDE